MNIGPQDTSALLSARAFGAVDPGRDAKSLLQRAETKSNDPEKLAQAREAAKRLEGVFATMLVKEMRGSQSGSVFGEGTGSDVYGGWFDQFIGDVLAKHGELHLASSIERSLADKEEAVKP